MCVTAIMVNRFLNNVITQHTIRLYSVAVQRTIFETHGMLQWLQI